MKKLLCVIICLVFLLLAGCSGQDMAETQPPTEPTEPEVPVTTVMVYMIGSDLEAKAGAGTNDLQEMADSGVDLETTNVLVYAGGSKKWHNDVATEEAHTLMQLTAEGFAQVTAMPVASMGQAESLTAFLQYSYDNFPADNYVLVMWDHGDGPVIGYGKDMLYENDSLTLQEMQQALESSPFGPDNKLEWVGFDACLMASAELACVWADYAGYLVASQEIEPAFGWNYAFLGNVGKLETPDLLAEVTQSYLDSCLAYYAEKGYDNRDTTLACMDLSVAGELNDALNALFACATPDVADNYNQLTAKRVDTRALGRASTGSEYDLVDLYDMANQLSALYPAETAALQEVIDRLVVCNATNTEGCCGLSLYYPFYNKTYYAQDWNDIYTQLGLFPEYQNYLQQYATIWMASDKLETVAASILPSTVTQGQYALEMTPEQAEAYADARYFIFTRDGEGLYTPVFVSRNITRQGNTLYANFNGNVLYGRSNYNEYFIPVSTEHDTVGNLTHYSVYVGLNNTWADMFSMPEDFERRNDQYRYHLTVDSLTGEVTVGALAPVDEEVDSASLMGGKGEDADLSLYSHFMFMQERHRYLVRYDNGVICPLSQWPASAYYSGYELAVGDGVEFVMAPLATGEYYLIYEIEDTQGNRYCSELLPIYTEGQTPLPDFPETIDVSWQSGDRVLLFDQQNVSVYLKMIESMDGWCYTLEAENRNDFDVYLFGTDIVINDNIYCHDGYVGSFTIPAGQTACYEYGMDVGDVEYLGYDVGMTSLELTIKLSHAVTDTTLVFYQTVRVELSEQTTLPEHTPYFAEFYVFDQPVRGILANEQVLVQEGDITVTLLGLGGNGIDTELQGYICVENTGDAVRYVELQGFVLDDVYLPARSSRLAVYPGLKLYDAISIAEDDLDISMVQSASTLQIQMRTMEFDTLEGGGGFSQIAYYPVTLAQSGQKVQFKEGQTLLLDEGGIRIALISEEAGYGYTWYLSLVNNTDQAISLDLVDLYVNGQLMDLDYYHDTAIYDSQVGAGQKCVCHLSYFGDAASLEALTFRISVMDFSVESVLDSLDTVITLSPQAGA